MLENIRNAITRVP